MDPLTFSQLTQDLRTRFVALNQQATQMPATQRNNANLWVSAIQELQAALEELSVAEEELRLQNEELLATRWAVEVERQRYRELFEFAPDAYLVTDQHGTIQEANRVAGSLFDVEPSYLTGKPITSFVLLQDRSDWRQRLLQIRQAIAEAEWEVSCQSRSGKQIDIAVKVAIVRDGQGQVSSLRWLLRDLTTRKQTERELHTLNSQLIQRDHLNTIIKVIGDQLRQSLDRDEILHITVCKLTEALGLTACNIGLYDLESQQSIIYSVYRELDEHHASLRLRSVMMQEFEREYDQLLHNQEFQFCAIVPDAQGRRLSMLACPILDQQQILGDLWCFSNSERYLTLDEIFLIRQVCDQCAIALRQAHLFQEAQLQVVELQKLNWLKEDFLSAVSHELRTPLTNIKMALHLMQLIKTEEQQSRCLNIMQMECDREIDLVTNLLDLQELEAERYPIFIRGMIDLQEWLPMTLAPLRRPMQEQQQTLTVTLAEQLPPLFSDQNNLRRILVELLRNAHKYTPVGGEVRLAIAYNAQHAHFTFVVQNQAEIPSDQLERIFEKFYRSPQPTLWQTGGIGLGLSLVKKLVEHLQGQIEVNSRNGWTTFLVQLPSLSEPV
jgi:PAS domain S-box-containing protein